MRSGGMTLNVNADNMTPEDIMRAIMVDISRLTSQRDKAREGLRASLSAFKAISVLEDEEDGLKKSVHIADRFIEHLEGYLRDT